MGQGIITSKNINKNVVDHEKSCFFVRWMGGFSASRSHKTTDNYLPERGGVWEGVWHFVCQPRDLSHYLNFKKKSFLGFNFIPQTVDGKNIRDSPVDVVNILFTYRVSCMSGGANFLPSTVSTK